MDIFFVSTTPGSSFSRNVDFRPYFCSALRGNGFVQNSTFCGGGGYRPASHRHKRQQSHILYNLLEFQFFQFQFFLCPFFKFQERSGQRTHSMSSIKVSPGKDEVKKEKEDKKEVKMVSVFKLFRHSSQNDRILLAFGLFFAMYVFKYKSLRTLWNTYWHIYIDI